MFALNYRLAILFVLFSILMAVIATPVLRVPPARERALIKQARNLNLTNAQRFARELPPNKPKRHFNRE